MITFGQAYMSQIVRNAQVLGAALTSRGITMLGAHKGYTATHQVIADVRQFGGGLEVAQRLARTNIIKNKNLIPSDKPQDWDRPGGLRIGTTEITRLGMKEQEMEIIAEFMARVLINQEAPQNVVDDVVAFRKPYQTVYYCFDHGFPV
jgi:glycine hydroxymethyltransferase